MQNRFTAAFKSAVYNGGQYTWESKEVINSRYAPVIPAEAGMTAGRLIYFRLRNISYEIESESLIIRKQLEKEYESADRKLKQIRR